MDKDKIINCIREAAEKSKTTNTFVLQELSDIPSDVAKEEIAIKVLARQEKSFPNLEEFHIVGCNIKKDGFRFLAAGLKGNTKITLVDFSGSDFDDSMGRDLALVIKSNTAIKTLCISGCAVSENGFKMIMAAVKGNKVLESLVLSGTALTDTECEHISEMLNGNTSLTSLFMQGCGVTSHGLFVISQALKFNNTLQRLDLSDNNFDNNYGMENMGLALKDNKGLKVLNLSSNSIKDEAAAAIFMGLGRNTTLENFAMSRIEVEEAVDSPAKAVVEMAEMLKTNRTLKYLSVFSFVFRNPGIKLIASALKKNTTLEELAISGNQFDNEGAKYLLSALDVNKTLSAVYLTNDDTKKEAEILNPTELDSDDSDSDSEEDLMIISDDMFMEIKKKLRERK